MTEGVSVGTTSVASPPQPTAITAIKTATARYMTFRNMDSILLQR